VRRAAQVILSRNALTIFWAACLRALAREPERLIPVFGRLLEDVAILALPSTHQEAGEGIRAAFRFMDDPQRDRVEAAVSAIPDSDLPGGPRYLEDRQYQLIGCLAASGVPGRPRAKELAQLLVGLKHEGGPPPNKPLAEHKSTTLPEPVPEDLRQDVKILREFNGASKPGISPSPDDVVGILPAIQRLSRRRKELGFNNRQELRSAVSRALCVEAGSLGSLEFQGLRNLLLEWAAAPGEDEAGWRGGAASCLPNFFVHCRKLGMQDPQTLGAFDRLLSDPSPVVRQFVVWELKWLAAFGDKEAPCRAADHVAESEEDTGVLEAFLARFVFPRSIERPKRALGWVQAVMRRVVNVEDEPGDDSPEPRHFGGLMVPINPPAKSFDRTAEFAGQVLAAAYLGTGDSEGFDRIAQAYVGEQGDRIACCMAQGASACFSNLQADVTPERRRRFLELAFRTRHPSAIQALGEWLAANARDFAEQALAFVEGVVPPDSSVLSLGAPGVHVTSILGTLADRARCGLLDEKLRRRLFRCMERMCRDPREAQSFLRMIVRETFDPSAA
jgi:hypothetical protein